MVELRLFGTVDLRREGGGSIGSLVVQPKRMALLAYLAAATPRGAHRRDTLLGLLWPELDGERGRGALSKALHHLRASLGKEALLSHGEEAVELDGTRVGCDVARFEEALDGGDLERSLTLYRGDLLQGFFLPDAPEFERWVEGERSRLRRRAAHAASTLSETARESGDRGGATRWAREALALSGLEEGALRRLLTLLDAEGDRGGALEAYTAFAATLQEELQVEPSPETRALVEEIRERGVVRSLPTSPIRESLSPYPKAGPPLSSGPVPPPLPLGDRELPAARSLGHRARRPTPILLALLILLVLFFGYRVLAVEGDPPLEARRVLVLPFQNHSLDPELDPVGRVAADWITDGISRTGAFEVVPSSAVRTLGGGGGAPPGVGEVGSLARETGAGIVVSGSYFREGDRLHLQAVTLDAASGRVLRAVGRVSTPADSIIEGIDALRDRVLAVLAPLADTVFHLRMAAPPPSFEAYRIYVNAMERFVAGDAAAALRGYEEAARADSAWVMPRLASAIMHGNLGNYDAKDSIVAPLLERQDGLPSLERGTVDMILGVLRGDHLLAYRGMSEAARVAPGTINEFMVGELARKLNRPAEAVAVLEAMGGERGELRGWTPYWRELAWSLHMLGRHEEELGVARRARTLYPDDPLVLSLEVRALAALGRVAEVRERVDERVVSTRRGSPEAGELMSLAARVLEAKGNVEEGGALRERALAWFATREEGVRRGPEHRQQWAMTLADAGLLEEARAILEGLREQFPADPVLTGQLGVLLARGGDREGALALSAEAARYTPRAGRSGSINLALGRHTRERAVIAAWLGDLEGAVALLQQAQGEGLIFAPWIHTGPELGPLRDYPPFLEWLAPRG